MKKSSIKGFNLEIEQMDSADGLCACDDSAASACAAWVGEAGDDSRSKKDGSAKLSIRARLMASACRLGGPLRRTGRDHVQGILSAAQGRHGGPVSSHCRSQSSNDAMLYR